MRLFNENTSKALVWIGIGLFTIGIILFLWNENYFDSDEQIDTTKIGQFGDYVGGLIGSLWALAGVILFYVALTEQRVDIKTNRDVLTTQVDALKQQIKEFELQREEMELTREVFIEQSKTLKKQQFESTFFNSVNLLNNIIQDINFVKLPPQQNSINTNSAHSLTERTTFKGRASFEFFYDDLIIKYKKLKSDYWITHLNTVSTIENKPFFPQIIEEKIASESYEYFFDKYQSDLGHYFRTIYNIIKFIDDSKPENPKYYTNIVRAQLSTYEHLLLFYNCFSDYGVKKFKPLVVEYSLLDNMTIGKLLNEEHRLFYPEKAYE